MGFAPIGGKWPAASPGPLGITIKTEVMAILASSVNAIFKLHSTFPLDYD